jgi:hypothetical protein
MLKYHFQDPGMEIIVFGMKCPFQLEILCCTNENTKVLLFLRVQSLTQTVMLQLYCKVFVTHTHTQSFKYNFYVEH